MRLAGGPGSIDKFYRGFGCPHRYEIRTRAQIWIAFLGVGGHLPIVFGRDWRTRNHNAGTERQPFEQPALRY
jgi:hypothetical protein